MRAKMTPPSPAANAEAKLNPAVREIDRVIPGRRSVVVKPRSRVGAACVTA